MYLLERLGVIVGFFARTCGRRKERDLRVVRDRQRSHERLFAEGEADTSAASEFDAFFQHLRDKLARNILLIAVGYTKRDVIYKWNSDRQVAIADDMKLSQSDLVANPTANYSASATLSHGESNRFAILFHAFFFHTFISPRCSLFIA